MANDDAMCNTPALRVQQTSTRLHVFDTNEQPSTTMEEFVS
jgi:hypothetical protein